MRFSSLCDHRCGARRAHRTRNLKFMLRRYANASSQRIHRVSKRLHKTCAKPQKTASSEKSGFVAFFVTIVSNKHSDRNDGGRTSARTNPGRRPLPHPNSGAGWCEPLWYAPRRRAPAADTARFGCANASVHPRRPRAKPGRRLHAALGAPHPSLQPTLRRSRRNGRSGTCCAVGSVGVVGAKPRSHATPFDARFLSDAQPHDTCQADRPP